MPRCRWLCVAFLGLNCVGECFDPGDANTCYSPQEDVPSGCSSEACERNCRAQGRAGGTCQGYGWSSSSCECFDRDADADVGGDGDGRDGPDGAAEDGTPDAPEGCRTDVCGLACSDAGFAGGFCDEALCVCTSGADADGDGDDDGTDVAAPVDGEEPDEGGSDEGLDVGPPACGNGVAEPPEECDGDPARPCMTWCWSIGANGCVDCWWSPTCIPPAAELCNGVDDDCDLGTDEDLPLCDCVVQGDFESDLSPFAACLDADCTAACDGVGTSTAAAFSGTRSLRVADSGYDPAWPACRAHVDLPVDLPGPHATSLYVLVPAVASWASCAGAECDMAPVLEPLGTFARSGWLERDGRRMVRWSPDRWMHFEIEYSCEVGAGILRFLLDGVAYFSEGSWLYRCDVYSPGLRLDAEVRGAPAVYLDDVCLRRARGPGRGP